MVCLSSCAPFRASAHVNRSRAYGLSRCRVQELDGHLGRETAGAICSRLRPRPPPTSCTWVVDLIGLHFLSDFKKDVELIVLDQPARHRALQSPLTRFTSLPGDRH